MPLLILKNCKFVRGQNARISSVEAPSPLVKFNKWEHSVYAVSIFFYICMYIQPRAFVKLKRVSCALLSTHGRCGIKIKGIFINLYIFYYTSNSTFLIHAYVCTLAIIRTFVVILAEDYKSSFVVKFETTINDRIDFHKEEQIPP